jgi:hypothetical protein
MPDSGETGSGNPPQLKERNVRKKTLTYFGLEGKESSIFLFIWG